MALESLPKIAPALFSAEQDLIQIYNKKSDTFGTINASLLGGSTPPSGVSGAIQFSNGSAFASDGANLFWDNVNKRLGVGTNVPTEKITAQTSSAADGISLRDASNQLALLGKWFDSSGFLDLAQNGTPYARIQASQSYLNTPFTVGSASALSARLGIKGSGSTSATFSLLVQNSAGTTLMSIADNGNISMGAGSLTTFTGTVTNTTGPMQALNFATSSAPFNFGTVAIYGITGTAPVVTSGQRDGFLGQFTFAPTSGTAVLNVLNVSPTINQTGGANGITRGLFIDPTLTAAADFRAIETTRGNVLLATTSGNVGIGTTTPASQLEIKGNGDASFQISGGTAGRRALFSYFNAPSVFEFDVSNILRIKNGSTYSLYTDTTGSVGIGTLSPSARTHIVGAGSTSATTSLLVQNSSGTAALTIRDDREATFGSTINANYINMQFTGIYNGEYFSLSGSGGRMGATGIVTGASTLNASAILQADSTTKGFLAPRMTDAQVRAIASPAEGLIAYNTTINHLCAYQGGVWVKFNHSPM